MAPPRRFSRAHRPWPGEGAEPPGRPARPPARPPDQRHQPRERAGRQLRCPRSPSAPHCVRRPARLGASLARPPAVAAELGAAPARGTTSACALAYSRSPARGVLTHLAPAGEVRGEGAPGSRASLRCGSRGPRNAEEGGSRVCTAGTGAGRPPGSKRRRVPSARAGPAGRPAGAAQLRN